MRRSNRPAWTARSVRAGLAAAGSAGAFTLALGLLACTPAAPREYAGHGEAVAVDAAAHTVTLEHDDIPDLMKAMTMTFDVAPHVELEALAPGTEVDFRLSDADGRLTVVEIRPLTP